MPDTGEQLTAELEELITIGKQLLTAAMRSDSSPSADSIAIASEWVARTGHVIHRLYEPASPQMARYDELLAKCNFQAFHSSYYEHLASLLGLCQATLHHLGGGLLRDLKVLLRAEVFADFLAMAQHLLETKYKDAAAVLAGAVLEDALRKLASSRGVPIVKADGKPLTLEPLNLACAKSGAYNALVQKQMTSWGELRNRAAHGEYDAYDAEQVRMMLLFVEKFCCDYGTR